MQVFYELIQVALGVKSDLSMSPSPNDWRVLFELSKQQAITGVLFEALDGLSKKGHKIPSDILFEWISLTEHIKTKNQLVNNRCLQVSRLFADAKFRSCILKGQGNALMYPNPLLRMPGDIDIWLDGSKESINYFLFSNYPNAKEQDLHVEVEIFEDVPVEVHYKPQYSVVPSHERRLQQWFKENKEAQFKNIVSLYGINNACINIPTPDFNVVLQMSHMMGHFLTEGVGLRHLMDYYYLLNSNDFTNKLCYYESLFNFFGMKKFAQGVMWIERSVFGLEDFKLLVKPSERIGKMILKSVMMGGNFGFYRTENVIRGKNILFKGLFDAYRLFKLIPVQPMEVYYRLLLKFTNLKSIKKVFCI